MGKRKEKGGRRQILQLDDEAPSHNYSSGAAWPSYIPHPDQCLPTDADEKKSQGNPLSGLLSHYMNSEDEDSDENDSPERAASENAIPHTDGHSPKRMDVEVADFLKEIDSMKVEGDGVSNEKSLSRKAESKTNSTENATSLSSASTVPQSLWQECFDESSGYTYYWNMMTNEVTWDCPVEHRIYLESLASQVTDSKLGSNVATSPASKSPTAPAAPSVSKRNDSRKVANSPSKLTTQSEDQSPSDDEGKMEPITFYGPSSSNDESSDSDSESPTKRPVKGPVQYGPQLPPSSFNSSPVEFGPQLPSELAEADAERSVSSPTSVPTPNVEAEPTVRELQSEVEPNLDMAAADAMMHSPQASSPPTTSNEVTSQIATSNSSDESQTAGECNMGPSLLHLSYLDDVDEPDSTTRPQPPPAESDSVPQSLFLGPLHTPQLLPTTEDEPQTLGSPKSSEPLMAEHVESSAANHSDTEDHDRHEQLPVVAIAGPVLPSTFYDDDPIPGAPGRRGFGFGKGENAEENVGVDAKKHRQSRHSKKKKKAISFVKAETLDLTELNRHVASEWSVATSEATANSPLLEDTTAMEVLPVFGPRLPENGVIPGLESVAEVRPAPFIGPLPPDDHSVASESLPANEPDPGSDLVDIDDIDEIDRALDLAFERKRSAQIANQNGGDRNEDNESDSDPQDIGSDEDKVAQLSLTILERFAHAGITSDSVAHLQTLYVQTKTRLEDWRRGALDSLYLLRCLQETERETWRRGLLGAVSSSDRDCRANKRLRTDDTFLEPDTTRQHERRRKTTDVSPPSCANSVSSSTGPSSFLPFLAPPPPPPPTPPPDSPPPPPPDSTETGGQFADTEEAEAKMEEEDEPTTLPKPEELPATSASTSTPASTSTSASTSTPEFYTDITDLHPKTAEVPTAAAVEVPAVVIADTQPITYAAGVVAPAMIARPPVPSAAVDLQMELSSFYSDLTALSEAAPPPPTASPPLAAAPTDPSSHTVSAPVIAASPAGTKHAAPTTNRKEKKLKKARMAPGLVLKKKNIPSLVEKWRKIKQEQALESSDEDESKHSGGVPPPD